jgi:hypothetical protein
MNVIDSHKLEHDVVRNRFALFGIMLKPVNLPGVAEKVISTFAMRQLQSNSDIGICRTLAKKRAFSSGAGWG